MHYKYRSRFRHLSAALAVSAVALVSACSSTSSPSASNGATGGGAVPGAAATSGGSGSSGGSGGGGTGTVGMTLLSLQFPFLVNLSDSAKKEASTNNIKLISLDPRGSVATETSQVENLITQKVKVVVMIPVDQKESQAAAKKVNAANIPLILTNNRFTDAFTQSGGKFVSFVGSDDAEAGKIEGDYLIKQLPQGGNAVYIVNTYGASSTERRKLGFNQALQGHGNIKVVSEQQGHGSRAEGKTLMENYLTKYKAGQLQAVVAQTDEMALGAASAIKAAGRLGEFKVIIGVDGEAPALAAVKSGDMTATVFQDAVAQGSTAMDVARQVLDGKTPKSSYIIPFRLITKDNVSTMK